jgi:dUTP pyrophosphatase
MKLELIKTHENAILPSQNNTALDGTGDTGYDLYAVEDVLIPGIQVNTGTRVGHINSAVVPVGLEIGYIEPGYWLRIEGRSGLGFKHGIQPHFGIIDNQYRGGLGVKLYNLTSTDYQIKAGDKVAQIVGYKLIEMDIEFTDTKSDSTRGEKGFGSSGR